MLPNGKRTHEVIELSDSDTEHQSHVQPRKTRRIRGTHNDPIRLSDSNSDSDHDRHLPVDDFWNRHDLPASQAHLAHQFARLATPSNGTDAPMESNQNANLRGYWNGHVFAYDYGDDFDHYTAFGDVVDNGDTPNYRGSPLHEPARYPTSHHQAVPAPLPTIVTEEACLARVLEMFPDISHAYVADVHKECIGRIQQIMDKIVDEPEYPKERDSKKKEPEGEKESTAEAEEKRFTQQDRELVKGKLHKVIVEILKHEFPKIPVHYIDRVQAEKTHLYPSYMTLVESQYAPKLPYTPTGWRNVLEIDFSVIVRKYGPTSASLEAELAAAKRARVKIEAEHRKKAARTREEEANIERSKAEGATSEWYDQYVATCFDEYPINRMIRCNASTPHLTCYECATSYISSEVGQSRCRLTCPDMSGCDGSFTEVQLHLVPDKDLVDKLLKLQLEQDVRDAGLDDVIECPFCDYKQVCPPVDVDFEFRCGKPECSMVSCRKCQQQTHIPLTCEEAAKLKSKDTALTQRHTIEEAMTAALVRNCNRCKKPFIKDYGCNKMTCPSCNNLQCYVCSQTVTDYTHFHRQGGCPLHDNLEERHAKEVQEAEAAARAKVVAENPLISKEDLDFQLSERVKKDEEAAEARRRQINAAGGGGNAGIANYAAIYGNEAVENEAARYQQQQALLEQQRVLQHNIDLNRRVPEQGQAPDAVGENLYAFNNALQHHMEIARRLELIQQQLGADRLRREQNLLQRQREQQRRIEMQRRLLDQGQAQDARVGDLDAVNDVAGPEMHRDARLGLLQRQRAIMLNLENLIAAEPVRGPRNPRGRVHNPVPVLDGPELPNVAVRNDRLVAPEELDVVPIDMYGRPLAAQDQGALNNAVRNNRFVVPRELDVVPIHMFGRPLAVQNQGALNNAAPPPPQNNLNQQQDLAGAARPRPLTAEPQARRRERAAIRQARRAQQQGPARVPVARPGDQPLPVGYAEILGQLINARREALNANQNLVHHELPDEDFPNVF